MNTGAPLREQVAKLLDWEDAHVGLGSEADVAVFSLEEGDFELVDAQGETRIGHRKLVPLATVKAGKIYGSASIPVAEASGL